MHSSAAVHYIAYVPVICFSVSVILFTTVGLVYIHLRYRKLTNVSLANKHVVITGGSSGIGKCLAEEAAILGASVTIIARDKSKLESAKKDLAKFCRNPNQKINAVSLDVCGSYEKIEQCLLQLDTEFAPIFMLINCAGNCVPGILEETSPVDVKRMLEINCLSAMYVTKAVVENMKSRQEGHIVLVSSQAGLLGIYGLSAYCASKFALRGFAEALQTEVGHCGIKVTVALPPDTDTPGYRAEQLVKPEVTKILCEGTGLKSPEEVANQTMKDILAGAFFSNFGLDGFLMGTLSLGFAPAPTLFHYVFQAAFIGPLRAVALLVHMYWSSVIKKCQIEKDQSKKSN